MKRGEGLGNGQGHGKGGYDPLDNSPILAGLLIISTNKKLIGWHQNSNSFGISSGDTAHPLTPRRSCLQVYWPARHQTVLQEQHTEGEQINSDPTILCQMTYLLQSSRLIRVN